MTRDSIAARLSALLLFEAAAIFVAFFLATQMTIAHYSHCDPDAPWTVVPCNDVNGGIARYHAGQEGNWAYPLRGSSNGIEAFISAQDVAIHDVSNDFISN